VSNYAHRAVTA